MSKGEQCTQARFPYKMGEQVITYMAASLGKMPTPPMRRLISPLTRSIGLVKRSFVLWSRRESQVGEDIGFRPIHQVGELCTP